VCEPATAIRDIMTITDDPLLRPLIFGILLILFAVCERLLPRRALTHGRISRWSGNLGVLVIGSIVARAILPVAPIGVAIWAQRQDVGLFNVIDIPVLLAGILAFLMLDLWIYAQHRLFHWAPLLWRLHRMHHTDMDLDVTSGLRFHPLELLLSLILKIIAVCALGVPPVAVVVFEIVLNATSMFNHSNLALPLKLDAALRLIVVTPDMHRVHHSIRPRETNSNFGFNIPWWDRLFGTYVSEPVDSHTSMTIGLPIFRDHRATRLKQLLIQPFIEDREAANNKGGEETPPP